MRLGKRIRQFLLFTPLLWVSFLSVFVPVQARAEVVPGTMELVDKTRIGRTDFQYTYRLNATNNGGDISNVRATVTSSSPHTVILDGGLQFADMAAGASAASLDTFSFKQNRRYPFDPSALTFSFSFQDVPPPDLDGDGIPDALDPDRDGDGIDNALDAYPDQADVFRGAMELVDKVRVGRTEIRYIYRLSAINGGGDRVNISAAITSLSPNTVIDDGSVQFADMAAGATSVGLDTFSFIQNRRYPFNPDDLVFAFAWEDPPVVQPLALSIDTPDSLITVGTSPIEVTGSVSPPDGILTVNGVQVPHANGAFRTKVTLVEGSNTITARLVSGSQQIIDSISVSLDTTPPYLTVESHKDGDTVFTDTVTITGLVNDIVRGTITPSEAVVTVNGIPAVVSNRSYAASNVPLAEGPNTIVVRGADNVGNTGSTSITLNRVTALGYRLELLSGQDQTAVIGDVLPRPLLVRVVDASGNPVEGRNVVFRVIQGSGRVGAGSAAEDRAFVVATDANGQAQTDFRVGARVGVSNHKVRVSVVGIEGELVFNASATGRPGDKLTVNSGNNQRGAVGQRLPQPFVVNVTDDGANAVEGARVRFQVSAGDGTFVNGQQTYEALTDGDGYAYAQYVLGSLTGLDAQRVTATLLDSATTEPLTAGFTATAFVPGDAGNTRISGVVLDNQDNPLPGVTVRVDGTTRQATTDAQGQFVISQAPVGPVHLVVDGSTTTAAGEYPTLKFNVVTVAGVDNPLPQPVYMVRLTDSNMAFVGPADAVITMKEFPGFKLEVAANSATFPDGSRSGIVSVTSVNANKVPMAPPNGSQPQFVITVQPSGTRFDPPARITIPNVDGLAPGQQTEMYSFDHDLEEFVAIGLGTVSDDGLVVKSNPGVGIVKAGWFAAQPPGGSGDVEGDPNAAPGTPGDPNNPGAPSTGSASNPIGDQVQGVIDDQAGCKPDDPGCNAVDSDSDWTRSLSGAIDDNAETVGNTQQELENNSGNTPPPGTFDPVGEHPDTVFDKAQKALDPIIMSTGELDYTQTDLKIPGRGFDFELKRTYRSRLNFNGRLGYNWVFNYHQLLVVPAATDPVQDIVRSMEDGRQFTYTANADGSYTSPDNRFDVLTRNADGSFTIRRPDGFRINFDSQGLMTSQVDRFGNTMEFEYDTEGRLIRVIDTLGRPIVFTYRSDSGHIDTVTDFSGRSVRYYYDSNRDLIAVRTPVVTGTPNGNDFPNGKFTAYTYSSGFDETADPRLRNANHNLLTVTDPQGNVYLRNVYNNDPNSYEFDRIVEQQFGTAAQVFRVSYEQLNPGVPLAANLPKNRTRVIDRNGNRKEYIHNFGGMLLEERVYTNRDVNPDDPAVFVTRYTYNLDGLKLSVTYPEGNRVDYGYDSGNSLRYMQRNLLAVTYTPGPRGADQTQLVERFSYEPIYNLLRSTTNRRGFVTRYTFDYQHSDNVAQLAAELGMTEADVSALLASQGVPLSGGVSGRISGNVVRVDQPDVTLPDGSVQKVFSERSYNRFGQIIEETDPEGIVTQYQYYPESDPDGDGNETVSDRTLANDTGGYLRAVVRDAAISSRRTRPGPALAIREEKQYDAVGNEVLVTDGRGNSTRFIRNALNQIVRKISSTPFEYLTDYYYDANNNLVRVSRQNVSTTGPALSGFVHTVYRYNLLNDKTAEIRIPASGVYLETTYEYDANQNLVAIRQPEGNRVERVYDERDLVYTTTRGAGTAEASTRTLHYDGNGNLVREVDAADNNGDGAPESLLLSYDGYDRLIQTIDAAGNRMTYAYDANGNKVLERNYGNSGIAGIGNEILLTETAVRFDELDRPFQRDDSLLVNGFPRNVGTGLTPDDNKVTSVNWFDANGMVVRSVDDNGNVTTSVYDGLNRRVRVTDANGNVTATAYDNNSNITSVSVTEVSVEGRAPAKVVGTTFTYDELNRKTSETDAIGNTTRYRYDSRDNRIQTTDALGNITLFVYDGMDRLLEERQYLSEDGTGAGALDATNPTNRDGAISVFYRYDGNSRLLAQTDDNGNTTTYAYDALNRRIRTTYADATTVSMTFDADDNMLTRTDQNGSVFNYDYDVLNRLTRMSVTPAAGLEGSTEWTYAYDGLSRRMRATDNNDPALASDDAVVEYRYDSLNRILTEANNGLEAVSTYDGPGNRLSLRYPGGRQLAYSYDAIYNLKAIAEGATDIVQYDYAGRRVLERRYANGTRLSYLQGGADSGYDAINRVLRHQHLDSGGQALAGFEYAYDKANNRRYEIDRFMQLADVYEYDSAYRVIRAAYRVPANSPDLLAITSNANVNADVSTIVADRDEIYILDGVGNWSSHQTVSDMVSNAVGYQINEMNEYARIGATDQSHDANGNLLSDGERNYHYDAMNRLVRVTTLGGNTVATYKYDAFGRRIEKRAGSETVRYVHFGKRVLEERSVTNQVQRQYVYGGRIDEVLQLRTAGNDDYYYHDNSIGSVVALTDSSGAVIERYRYNAYGETTVLAADGNTVRAGSAVSNNYAYTGRRLDMETGLYYYRARYYSPERGRFIQRDPLGYVDGMGVYAYAGNNPVNFLDPDGTYAKQMFSSGVRNVRDRFGKAAAAYRSEKNLFQSEREILLREMALKARFVAAGGVGNLYVQKMVSSYGEQATIDILEAHGKPRLAKLVKLGFDFNDVRGTYDHYREYFGSKTLATALTGSEKVLDISAEKLVDAKGRKLSKGRSSLAYALIPVKVGIDTSIETVMDVYGWGVAAGTTKVVTEGAAVVAGVKAIFR